VYFLYFDVKTMMTGLTCCCVQFGNRLDDLLELVCGDVKGETVEEVEEELQVLQEKSDACGK
jgi:hypothetical protein